MHKTVVPAADNVFKLLITWSARNESSPEVGSSAKSKGGLFKISVAIERRFISPPERVLVTPELEIRS